MVLVVDKEKYYASVISYKDVGFNILSRLYIQNPKDLIYDLIKRNVPHVFIQTCNRIEIYSYGVNPINVLDKIGKYSYLTSYMREIRGIEVFKHLIRVLCGLEALAIGEYQISGQVRKWFNLAKELGALNSELEYLFNECFKVSKRIRSLTGYKPQAGYSVAILDIILREVGHNTRILLFGSGVMANEILSKLSSNDNFEIFVVSKSLDRVRRLSEKYNIKPITYNELNSVLPNVDVIVSATVSDGYVIDINHAKLIPKDTLIIDLGMPPNINPELKDYGFKVYMFNDISKIISSYINSNNKEISKIEKLIDIHVGKIEEKLDSLYIEDLINEVYKRAENIRVSRIKKLESLIKDREFVSKEEFMFLIDMFSKSLVRKILHNYTENIRSYLKSNSKELFPIIKKIFNSNR